MRTKKKTYFWPKRLTTSSSLGPISISFASSIAQVGARGGCAGRRVLVMAAAVGHPAVVVVVGVVSFASSQEYLKMEVILL
jgi:hypothetical protein